MYEEPELLERAELAPDEYDEEAALLTFAELLEELLEPEYEELLDELVVDEPRTDEEGLDDDEARETLCAPLCPEPANELEPLTFVLLDTADEELGVVALAERVDPERTTEPLLTAVLAPVTAASLDGLAEMPWPADILDESPLV